MGDEYFHSYKCLRPAMNLKRILLVEDDAEDVFLFNQALDCLPVGAFCKSVGNGQEAIEHLSLNAAYEVIFLDLNMPLMSGVECLRLIKEHEKYFNIPVVVFTTTMNPHELNHCMELGALAIFHKPNSFPELCSGLHNILMS